MPSVETITHDPLTFYTVATAVTVVVVSALLALVRLPGAWVPIRTWLIMLPIALGALWLGQLAWIALITVISLVAFFEFARVTKLAEVRPLVAVVVVAIVAENLTKVYGSGNTEVVAMKDVTLRVWAVEETGSIVERSVEECGFAYRTSGFPPGEVILEGEILLRPRPPEEIVEAMKTLRAQRRGREPRGVLSAGSTFNGWTAALRRLRPRS